ncbi:MULTISPECIES: shikimate dehydrogenase [Rhodomicrobium]|uniref:shikimate dehydrogenase family protein n=1 Tax=Rhodomicrobium TaxID=1068 RepID=UPI000B4B4175|nr:MULTISPECIES: shikimate dehydrogenase [Rhodomicrobium]
MATIRLGLIGDNIERSQSPRLHVLAGRLCGLDVRYDPLIPADMGLDFDAAFALCRDGGFRGINITYPYKETVFARLDVADATVRALGACNTVLFGTGAPFGANTDYSGFKTAFAETFGGAAPGVVAMAGAGGVGKAIGFALAELGASEIRVFDREAARSAALRKTLSGTASLKVHVAEAIEEAAEGADGLVNCTPLGMTGYPGTAIPRHVLAGRSWAFDAVYTPVETEFLRDAQGAGLATMSGYELFFYQGVDAFRIFTGLDVNQQALRRRLSEPDDMERAV